MAKKAVKPTHYLAQVGCESDKAGRFEPGDRVPTDVFPVEVVEMWLDQGVLAAVLEEGSDGHGKD